MSLSNSLDYYWLWCISSEYKEAFNTACDVIQELANKIQTVQDNTQYCRDAASSPAGINHIVELKRQLQTEKDRYLFSEDKKRIAELEQTLRKLVADSNKHNSELGSTRRRISMLEAALRVRSERVEDLEQQCLGLNKVLQKEKDLHAFDKRICDARGDDLNRLTNLLREERKLGDKQWTILHTIKAALNEADSQQENRATSFRQVPTVPHTGDTDWYPRVRFSQSTASVLEEETAQAPDRR